MARPPGDMLPGGWTVDDPDALPESHLRHERPPLTRIPDVLVMRSDDPGRHRFAPSEVVVALEIESPGRHVEDRVTEPALYARHGIERYWRVELDPPRVGRLRPAARCRRRRSPAPRRGRCRPVPW